MFKYQAEALSSALTRPETEDSWDSIAKAIASLTTLFNNGLCEDPSGGQVVMRTYSRSLINAMNSERTRLSGPAINLVSVAASVLGTDFEPLLSVYLPPLLTICARPNKIVIGRAKTCILSIVENTQLPAILSYLLHNVQDKAPSLRLVVAEAALACLNSLNPPDLEREARAKEIEAIIRSTARDANADVRQVGKQIFSAYKLVLPGRVETFTTPLTPTVKKYLDIKSKPQDPRSRSPSRSRPPSSRSIHSTRDRLEPSAPKSKDKAPTIQTGQPVKTHHRSASTQPSSSRIAESATLSKSGPGRLKPERPAGKDTMPPPDFIPVRPVAGASRPITATQSMPPVDSRQRSTAASSGPTRSAARATVPSSAVTTGPFRPDRAHPTTLKLSQSSEATAAEKHAMPNGPRRILLPDSETLVKETAGGAKSGGLDKHGAPNNAASTSSTVVMHSVPVIKASQTTAPLKRTVSKPQLTPRATEKFKPVTATIKSSTSTNASNNTKVPERATKTARPPATDATTSDARKATSATVKSRGLTAPTAAQAAKMKPPVEKKPSASTSATKPVWGGRPAPKKPLLGADPSKVAIRRKVQTAKKAGQPSSSSNTTGRVTPALVPLPPSPGHSIKSEKTSAVDNKEDSKQVNRAVTPTLVPLPPSPSSKKGMVDPSTPPKVRDTPNATDHQDQQMPAGEDVTTNSTPRGSTPSNLIDDDIPADLQIILTASSPASDTPSSDAPSSDAPSTPQSNHKISSITGQEKTPISALLASIEQGFNLSPASPLSPPASYVARVKAAELALPQALADRRDSWAETRHILNLEEGEVPFGISSIFSKRSTREALSNVEVNQ